MARVARFLVKELAEARGLDAAKLARRADLGYNTVYQIWNNQTRSPGLEVLLKIAKALGVEITDLYVEEEDGKSANS